MPHGPFHQRGEIEGSALKAPRLCQGLLREGLKEGEANSLPAEAGSAGNPAHTWMYVLSRTEILVHEPRPLLSQLPPHRGRNQRCEDLQGAESALHRIVPLCQHPLEDPGGPERLVHLRGLSKETRHHEERSNHEEAQGAAAPDKRVHR